MIKGYVRRLTFPGIGTRALLELYHLPRENAVHTSYKTSMQEAWATQT